MNRRMTPEGHRQVIVKVNAPVDEGVAPLVVALNRLPGILTVESCQGRPSDRDGDSAWVAFSVSDAAGVADYAHRLAMGLAAQTDLDFWFKVTVEWFGGGDAGLGYIRVSPNPAHIRRLASAVAGTRLLRQCG